MNELTQQVIDLIEDRHVITERALTDACFEEYERGEVMSSINELVKSHRVTRKYGVLGRTLVSNK